MTGKKTATVKKTKAKKKAATTKAAAPKAAAPKAKAKAKKPTATKKSAATKKTAAAKKTAVKPKPEPAPKKKAAAAPKKKALATKKPTSRPRPRSKVPPSRPSDRAMAIVAQLPAERALTDEEREAMAKCAQTALAALVALVTAAADGAPDVIVSCIGGFVDDIRMGRRPEPSSQDIRLGLGVLWGEQVRAQVGWRWVHLSYPNGFASYAVVPDDRAFACFPLNRLTDLMRSGADVMNTSVPLFDSIRIGALPARRENAYLVIG